MLPVARLHRRTPAISRSLRAVVNVYDVSEEREAGPGSEPEVGDGETRLWPTRVEPNYPEEMMPTIVFTATAG